MAKTYILFDTMNCMMRAKHIVKADTLEDKVNLGVHLLLNIIMKCYNKFNSDGMIFCFEGSSWRKSIYPAYKGNRAALKLKKTPQELEEDKKFIEAVGVFQDFIHNKTNSLMLQHELAEADDMITRFIKLHPNDLHIIVSSDTDFVQLLDNNVLIYDGMKQVMITKNGVYDDMGQKLEFTLKNDGKLKIEQKINEDFSPLYDDWVDYSRFCKIVRGDTSDNIFSVYPGLRQKSTKKTAGLEDIYKDKKEKGFIWNNFMNTEVDEIDGTKALIKDKYKLNEQLIDLRCIPIDVQELIDDEIKMQINKPIINNVGVFFLSFCSVFKLNEFARQSNEISLALSKKIGNEINV